MRNQPETLHEYNIPRLHWWFLISGALFVGCILLMIWVDYSGGEIRWLGVRGDRSWKQFQKEFYKIDQKRLAADVKASEVRAQEEGSEKILAELAQATKELAAKRAEEDAAKVSADALKVTDDLVTRQFIMQKAIRDQFRSSYDEALERANLDSEARDVVAWRDKVKAQNEFVDKLDLRKQTADADYAIAKAKLETIVGYRQQLEKKKSRLEATTVLMQKRLDQLTNSLVQAVVNAPIIDFAAGNYKVEQIVTEGHHVDVNFATVPRVDRCTTCHKAIDRKDPTTEELDWRAKHKIEAIEWSKLPQPLRNHPRLDLFVGDTSPHPAEKYGCTVCHWGWDRETTFSRAGHTPEDEKQRPYVYDDKAKKWKALAEDEEPPKDVKPVEMTQRVAWEKNYHWEEQEFLRQPMRTEKYVQAACLKCHADETWLDGGDKLDHGRRLIEQLGCWSCHKMKQIETYTVHHTQLGEDFDSICKFYDVDPDDVRRLNNLPEHPVLKVGQDLNIPIRTLRKPGPSLYKIAGKTNKDWTRKWLGNPVAFRPNTYMPRFWGLDNNKQTPERNTVEINAITEFLFASSDAPPYSLPPVQGDADHGKQLVSTLGCMACHVVGDRLVNIKPPAQLAKYMDDWQYRRFRSQGPQLEGMGSKTTVNWIYAWLKNPKQYHPRTKMPNLRLNDQEAADIAAYLASLHNEATDKETLPAVDPQKLDAETIEYLEVTLPEKQAREKINNLDDLIESYFVDEDTMAYYSEPARLAREEAQQAALKKKAEEEFDDAAGRQAEQLAGQIAKVKTEMQAAHAKVAAMSAEQKKNVFLGSRLIARYGCFACHDIHGFESAKPIGTELSEWGSKPVDKLDFGLLDIEQTREAWLTQKLKAPRSYDTGRLGVTRTPLELLKMPKFNVTDEQIDQIITVVTGMTDEKLLPDEPQQLTPAEFQIERGRWMVKEMNCQGCHLVEGQGWGIRATGIPSGMEPPMLSGTPTQLQQGQRTQPDWLFSFLKSPQTGEIRPWLKARMPTFQFSDGEANVLVRYFALAGRTQFPYQSPRGEPTADQIAAGKKLFEKIQCYKCHVVEGKVQGKPLAEIPEEQLTQLAPDFALAHARLQRDWIINRWLPNPLAQVPGTRMPAFDADTIAATAQSIQQSGSGHELTEELVDYIMSLGEPSEQTAQAAPPVVVNPPKQP
ncbi:MAG TPA: c-type cytochrome [Verrucomicrobiae bacterium]|nr:c-type cytochrome [Verrucomicrobiae bacterium]